MFRSLSPDYAVAPQLALADVARARDAGYRVIINNRPDGEEPSAPQGAAIDAEARAAGLAYHYIPVTHAGFSAAQLDAVDKARANAEGPVLAYCRSGGRSAMLWALAEARGGRNVAEIETMAAQASYDIAAIRPMLDAFGHAAGGA